MGEIVEEIYFVYETVNKNIAAYALSKPSLSGDYVQGFLSSNESFRTFKKDGFIDFFDSLEEAEECAIFLHSLESVEERLVNNRGWKKYKRYESPGMSKPLDFSGALEIHFTGFKKEDKERLSRIAKEAGMTVRADVTVNLHFLCGGYNAGPKKLEVSRMRGTIILHEPEFISFIKTGVIPDHYDD